MTARYYLFYKAENLLHFIQNLLEEDDPQKKLEH